MKNRLAIITTHPIQYNAPFFKALAQTGEVDLMVFYTWDKGSGEKHDPGFGRAIDWDIPLLEGYPYCFVANTASDPGSHHHHGIECPTLIKDVENFRPDAILVYGWNFHAHLRAMRHFKGNTPVWFRGDSTLLDQEVQTLADLFRKNLPKGLLNRALSYTKFILRKVYLTRVYRHIDLAFYTGVNNKAYFKAHGLKESQLVHMPHAVDNDFFSRDHEAREAEAREWRKKLGIAEDDFVVLFAGKLEPKKDPEILVKAVIELHELTEKSAMNGQATTPNCHLVMVGNGVLEENLKELAKDREFIHFLPFQNQKTMPVIYRIGNLFCLPSKGPGETWGLAINEVLACGRPVLVSDKVGGAPDLVKEGKTGWVFHAGDITHLKRKILFYLEHMGEKGGTGFREFVRKDFSIQKNADIMANCLKKQSINS